MTDDTERDRWLDEVQRLATHADETADPVPDDVLERATDLLRWRLEGDVGFVLAAPDLATAVRGPLDAPAVRFRSAGQTLVVAVDAGALAGSVEPWPNDGTRLSVETDRGIHQVTVDDLGWFHLAIPPGRRARLRVEDADGALQRTDWFWLNRDRSS